MRSLLLALAAALALSACMSDNQSSIYTGCAGGADGYTHGKCTFNDNGATRKRWPVY